MKRNSSIGLILTLILIGGFAGQSIAQREPAIYLNGKIVSGSKNPNAERDSGKTIYLDIVEPEFAQVQFYAVSPPVTMTEKIESILYGIYIDLPPEYDHYGYEIRRFMAKAGSEDTFKSLKNIKEEIKNTQRAEMVLDKWGEKVSEKIKALEAEIEAGEAEPSERVTFKINKAKVKAFMLECKTWIRNNRTLLRLLEEMHGNYDYVAPDFNFLRPADLDQFTAFYEARKASLKQIHEYSPFRMMIY